MSGICGCVKEQLCYKLGSGKQFVFSKFCYDVSDNNLMCMRYCSTIFVLERSWVLGPIIYFLKVTVVNIIVESTKKLSSWLSVEIISLYECSYKRQIFLSQCRRACNHPKCSCFFRCCFFKKRIAIDISDFPLWISRWSRTTSAAILAMLHIESQVYPCDNGCSTKFRIQSGRERERILFSAFRSHSLVDNIGRLNDSLNVAKIAAVRGNDWNDGLNCVTLGFSRILHIEKYSIVAKMYYWNSTVATDTKFISYLNLSAAAKYVRDTHKTKFHICQKHKTDTWHYKFIIYH